MKRLTTLEYVAGQLYTRIKNRVYPWNVTICAKHEDIPVCAIGRRCGMAFMYEPNLKHSEECLDMTILQVIDTVDATGIPVSDLYILKQNDSWVFDIVVYIQPRSSQIESRL